MDQATAKMKNGSNSEHDWRETPAGKALQDRLTSEKTLNTLNRLLDRLDTIEATVERLEQTIQRVPGMLAMAGDMADEAYAKAQHRGVEIEDRLKTATHIAERLTSPEMTKRMDQFITFSEQLPGLIAMGMDVLDDGYRSACERGIDIETLSKQGLYVLKQLTELLQSHEFKALMNSGVLEPETLKIIAYAGDAMVESQQQTSKSVGLFGLFREMRDPDTKRALGFLMEFAKRFGQQLEK